jgi:hypothetical protein
MVQQCCFVSHAGQGSCRENWHFGFDANVHLVQPILAQLSGDFDLVGEGLVKGIYRASTIIIIFIDLVVILSVLIMVVIPPKG